MGEVRFLSLGANTWRARERAAYNGDLWVVPPGEGLQDIQ